MDSQDNEVQRSTIIWTKIYEAVYSNNQISIQTIYGKETSDNHFQVSNVKLYEGSIFGQQLLFTDVEKSWENINVFKGNKELFFSFFISALAHNCFPYVDLS